MARINERHGGARKGAGRKTKAQEQDVIDLMDEAWPRASRIRAIKKHAAQAEAGDARSLKILLEHSYGKPTERHEHGGVDGEAIKFSLRIGNAPE